MSSSHPTRPYVFGSSTEEIERLQKLDRLLGPATRQFLGEAGIVEGMNVLDAGCGPGQMSFLLADTGSTWSPPGPAPRRRNPEANGLPCPTSAVSPHRGSLRARCRSA
jgi:hypothetical protein